METKSPLAFLLASLCTHPFEIDGEVKTVLPQGSPTSPTITNILCKKLDRRLNGLANRFGATYTRYADDITFSSPHNIYNDEAFNKELKRIIEEDQKLVINPKENTLTKSRVPPGSNRIDCKRQGKCPQEICEANPHVAILLGKVRL
jgi:RNA-directed DNA polymerase